MASNPSDFDEETSRRNYAKPYGSSHPIPTVQKYREHRDAMGEAGETENAGSESKLKEAASAVKHIFKGDEKPAPESSLYPAINQNAQAVRQADGANDTANRSSVPDAKDQKSATQSNASQSDPNAPELNQKDKKPQQTANDPATSQMDPRQKRKAMKKTKRDGQGREVTDPVTHLPIVVRDLTENDLKRSPENEPQYGSEPRTSVGLSGASKEETQLDSEHNEMQSIHQGMEKLFPPPNFTDTRGELVKVYQLALTVGLGSIVTLATLSLVILQLTSGASGGRWYENLVKHRPAKAFLPVSITVILSSLIGGALISGIRGWLGKKIEQIWDEEIWDAARQEEIKSQKTDELPESVAWLNNLLASVWPLINPDLFASVADMLEDVMQASLPKLVRMVSVDDLGQGSEAFRILGIRWLPTGAASQTVDDDGNLKPAEKSQESDRTASGEGHVEEGDDDAKNPSDDKEDKKDQENRKQEEAEKVAMREGMEAERGDFVNLEMAFAYRARSSGKSVKAKATNAHLYLKFYLPGGICVPVWVELKGIIGTMRLRLQQTPDPPFFSLCTLTFLGQPRADLSCVPLSKHSLNIMDVPMISDFVQSAIDAALAEYVAPKSLTLDLKDMLVGDDFKKDTVARGVVAILVKSAEGFKEGDGGLGPIKGTSDGYVSVSWGKFGKPMATTRIIIEENKPRWDQWAYILVGPDELNAEEKLRLQLWDSDKFTADDDLGRVEVDLKELIQNPRTKNKIFDREDRFTAEDPDEEMPGTLSWSVGYFEKLAITDEQLSNQTEDSRIKTKQDLKRIVGEIAERKFREATLRDESAEMEQQKAQDYKERETALIISSSPDPKYPSGILSIQIHNITGLQIQSLRKRQGRKDNGDHENGEDIEDNDDLPSSYCNIILNHQKVYKTRTKPKNAKPFFNAGTERFVKDWRNSEVIVSIRDSREGEDDALLGVVHLPLDKAFAKRSQTSETYPIAGGVGYGRVRISMVFRSTEMQAPESLLGWDYGTLEVKSAKIKGVLPEELKHCRLRMRSNISKAKVYPAKDGAGWKPKRESSNSFLAVHKRYACPLSVEFRKSSFGPDSTPAFAVFWLKEIADEDEKTVALKVWKGGKDAFKRASSCDGYEEFVGEEKPLGEIELTLKFWRGLSGWHKSWAEKSGEHGDVAGVMEVLDVVHDVEGDYGEGNDVEDTEDSSGDEAGADAKDDGYEEHGIKETFKKLVGKDDKDHSKSPKSRVEAVLNSHNDHEDGRRGPMAQLRDYKDHHDKLHRQHRGVMQWKGARKLNWMEGKMKEAEGKVEGIFHHGDREPGVETEV